MKLSIIIILFALINLPIHSQPYYGTYFGADGLSNTVIGKYPGRETSYRFRCEFSGTIIQLRIYLVYAEGGYYGGTGGKLKITLETDDNSKDHLPSGNVLATIVDNNPMQYGGNGYQVLYTFNKPVNISENALYHLHFTNPDADPLTNYISTDELWITTPPGTTKDRIPTGNIIDLALLIKNGNDPWTVSETKTPIFTLYYEDGRKQGQGYIGAASQFPRDIYGPLNKVRTNILVTGTNRNINKVWIRLKRLIGYEDLIVRLEKADGSLIEEGYVYAYSINNYMTWISVSFARPHLLLTGNRYFLVLSTGNNTIYQTYPIQDGGYGYNYNYMFSDGSFEYTTNGYKWNYHINVARKAQIYFETSTDQSTISYSPKYLYSYIDKSDPFILNILFSHKLADSLPSKNSFSISINGIERNINSLYIKNNSIKLVLSNPTLFEDDIKVSYYKPEYQPLQSITGGIAEEFYLEPVINNCRDPSLPNKLPIININFSSTVFSGFVYDLDASSSSDGDNDELTFFWSAPQNVPVSSLTGPSIKFLTPVVTKSEILTFSLKVTDGLDTVSHNFEVSLLPFKPRLSLSKVRVIEASDYNLTNYPNNVADGDLSTLWSVDGDNHWLNISLQEPYKISYIQIALLPDQMYESYFDIYASKDNISWEPIILNAASCGFSGALQNFEFPAEKSDKDFLYVKLVGHGSSINSSNNYSEVKIFGQTSGSHISGDSNITLYPNPLTDNINILILEPPSESLILRVFDFNGRLCMETLLDPLINNIQVPVDLPAGPYIVQILFRNIIVFSEKILVSR